MGIEVSRCKWEVSREVSWCRGYKSKEVGGGKKVTVGCMVEAFLGGSFERGYSWRGEWRVRQRSGLVERLVFV